MSPGLEPKGHPYPLQRPGPQQPPLWNDLGVSNKGGALQGTTCASSLGWNWGLVTHCDPSGQRSVCSLCFLNKEGLSWEV